MKMKRLVLIYFAVLGCFPNEIRKVHLISAPAAGLIQVEALGVTGWIYPPHLPQPTATVPLYGEFANGRLIRMAYSQGKPPMVLIGFVPAR